MSHAYHMQYLISKQISLSTYNILQLSKLMLKMEMNLHVNQHLKTNDFGSL